MCTCSDTANMLTVIYLYYDGIPTHTDVMKDENGNINFKSRIVNEMISDNFLLSRRITSEDKKYKDELRHHVEIHNYA